MRLIPCLPLLALIAACSQQAPAPDPVSSEGVDRASSASTATAPSAQASAAADAADPPGRQHRYTSLKNCKLLREEREEMPLTEVSCAGQGSYSLRILDSDARQRMTLVPSSGESYALPVDRIGGGAFSSFRDTAEWRGPAGEPFKPDALIVRYSVAEKPHPAPETSYLLVARLGADPCLVAVVPPGPGQNDSARASADGAKACLPG